MCYMCLETCLCFLQSDWSQHGAEAPDASLFRGWPDAPGLLRLKPGLGQRLTDGADPQRIPLNTSRWADGCRKVRASRVCRCCGVR